MAYPGTSRNAPCPCGSGHKYKKCCGLTRAEERLLREQVEVVAELASVPILFPLLRPRSEAIRGWVAAADSSARGERLDAILREGLSLLDNDDRARVLAHAEAYPEAWLECSEVLGGEDEAERVLLVGAVTAVLREPPAVDTELLEQLEEEAGERDDPHQLLAFVLEPFGLWSPVEAMALGERLEASLPAEGVDVDYLIAVAGASVDELLTDEHERRLDDLVQRVRASIPADGFPTAIGNLERACDAVDADREERRLLLAAMLVDTFLDLMQELEEADE